MSRSDHDPISPGFETGPYLKAGTMSLVLLGMIFVLWGSFAELDGAVIAPGKIAVEGSRKTVQATGSGVVSALLVEEGQEVHTGELLLRIDHTVTGAGLESATSQLDRLLAKTARLQAESSKREEIAFAEDLLARAIENPKLSRLLNEERAHFSARAETLRSEQRVLAARIAKLKASRAGHLARAEASEIEVGAAASELDSAKTLFTAGYLAQTRVLELERLHARAKSDLARSASEAERARHEIDEVRFQRERSTKQHHQNVLAELENARREIVVAREVLTAADQRVQHASVHAPTDGRIFGLSIHTVGGVVREGDSLLQIVPSSAPLIVEARIPLTEIDRVSPGQAARVQLSAFDANDVPPVEGIVESVSADRIEDADRGAAFYEAQIRIDPAGLATLPNLKLRAGMPADTWILTGSKTALQYLMKPLTDSWSRALVDG